MQQNKEENNALATSIHPQVGEVSSTFQYYEPTSQQYQYKIFINQCNGYVGSQLVEIFRNDDEIQVNPNIICGTEKKDIKTIGNIEVNNLIDIDNKRLLNSVWKNSDIIVYSLEKSNAKEFEYMIKFLRKLQSEQLKEKKPKRVICISSLLTWNAKRGNLDLKPSIDNLPNRNSTENYLLQLENLCLDLNNLNIGIQSFVVCAGIVYGYGQNTLFGYFKKALQQSQPLKVFGTGSNIIPMIHLEDLCNMVKDIAINGFVGKQKNDKVALPKSRYYFAVDNTKIIQLQLIKCIAETLGNGQFQQIPIENAFLNQNFDEMALNLSVAYVPSLEKWHSQGGFKENVSKIVSQFNLYRGLKPNKIIILGSPASGKSKIAENLQKAYGLPVLTIKKVLSQLLNEQNQFANEIKTKLEEIRTIKVQEQRKIFEQAKKKKKGKKDANDQFDPTKIIPRLPQDQLVRVFKNRLKKSDCLNKGYILDGWPKTMKSCQALFINEKGQIEQDILPNSCFVINATEDEVKQRVKTLPQNIKQTTHWNQQGTVRRFQSYAKFNEEGLPINFLRSKVDIKEVSFNYDNPQQFVEFVERNGPLGFKKKQKVEANNQQVNAQINKAEDGNKKQKQEGQQGQQDENEERQENYGEQNEEFDLQKLTQHEKEILNQKSRPIRQYLIDNVIPQITQGLLEISKQTPADPIDFLIKFLQTKEAAKKKK